MTDEFCVTVACGLSCLQKVFGVKTIKAQQSSCASIETLQIIQCVGHLDKWPIDHRITSSKALGADAVSQEIMYVDKEKNSTQQQIHMHAQTLIHIKPTEQTSY